MENRSFVSMENITLEEMEINLPQNINAAETDAIGVRIQVSNMEEISSSRITFVRPSPASEMYDTKHISCAKCLDDDSNFCKRIIHDFLSTNPHLKKCKRSVDGQWSFWRNGTCQAVKEVQEGKKCGEGWRMQERSCQGRRYGGKYCKGRSANHTNCIEEVCPGIVNRIG